MSIKTRLERLEARVGASAQQDRKWTEFLTGLSDQELEVYGTAVRGRDGQPWKDLVESDSQARMVKCLRGIMEGKMSAAKGLARLNEQEQQMLTKILTGLNNLYDQRQSTRTIWI